MRSKDKVRCLIWRLQIDFWAVKLVVLSAVAGCYAHAFDISGDVWILSGTVTNSVLQERMKLSEFYASRQEFRMAAEELSKIAEEYGPDNIVCNGEPLNLTIGGTILWYESRAASFKDPKVLEKANDLLKRYDEPAKGQAWQSYKCLFHRKRDFYFVKKDYAKALAVQKALILYDVFDNWSYDTYLEYLNNFAVEDNVETFVREVERQGGKIGPRMKLALIGANFAKDEKAAWRELLDWFDRNRQSDMETLKQGMRLAVSRLHSDDLETAKEYYLALTDVALGQVTDDEHMPLIAFVLNERQKIRTLVPGFEPK